VLAGQFQVRPIEEEGYAAMIAGVHKHQIVIATFDDAPPFWRAAERLVDAGIGTEQIEIMGSKSVLAGLSDSRNWSRTGLALIVSCRGDDDAPRAQQDGCRALCSARLLTGGGNIGLGDPPTCSGQDTCTVWPGFESDRQIRAGVVVLAVSPAGLEQHRIATRILLEYSSGHVQTREFHAPRRPEDCDLAASVR
jgi:hypothetical protein